MSEELQFSQRFGADQSLVCPECGKSMHVTRRSPDADLGQIFSCDECDYELERTADADGNSAPV
jgi:predicted RNA-binding Zn-ribbon protein involved in translation (DUF1610 family)